MRRRAAALMVRFFGADVPGAAAAGAGADAECPPIWLRRSAIFCSTWSRLCWKPIKAASSSSVSCLGVRGISLIISYLLAFSPATWVTLSKTELFRVARAAIQYQGGPQKVSRHGGSFSHSRKAGWGLIYSDYRHAHSSLRYSPPAGCSVAGQAGRNTLQTGFAREISQGYTRARHSGR